MLPRETLLHQLWNTERRGFINVLKLKWSEKKRKYGRLECRDNSPQHGKQGGQRDKTYTLLRERRGLVAVSNNSHYIEKHNQVQRGLNQLLKKYSYAETGFGETGTMARGL